jgi:hypothetical protein
MPRGEWVGLRANSYKRTAGTNRSISMPPPQRLSQSKAGRRRWIFVWRNRKHCFDPDKNQRIFVRVTRRRRIIVRPVFCSHDIGTADDWLPTQNVSWFCWDHPLTADKCLWLRAVLLFAWHRNRRWLAAHAKCFVVLLGSPADGGQMFFVRGQLSKIFWSLLTFHANN